MLVVDDNADAADSLAELALMFGHDVEIAYDGATALEKAAANTPDVVLCDIGMPGITGYEVARALRQREGENRIYLVAVTGYSTPEDVKKAEDAGFDEHIPKPPDPARLERLLG